MASVVESRVRRKKSRGGIGVFQFAQTVEHDVWEDERRQKAIQVRFTAIILYYQMQCWAQDQISRLAREASIATDTKLTTSPPGTSSTVAAKQQKEDLSRRYTILKPDDAETERRRPPTSPYVINPLG